MIKVVKVMAALFVAFLVMTAFSASAFASDLVPGACWGNVCQGDGSSL